MFTLHTVEENWRRTTNSHNHHYKFILCSIFLRNIFLGKRSFALILLHEQITLKLLWFIVINFSWNNLLHLQDKKGNCDLHFWVVYCLMYIYKKAKGGPSCRMRILRTNNYTKKTWHISPSKSNNQWPDISGKFMLLEWVGVVPEKNYRNISMKIPHYDIIVYTKWLTFDTIY